MEYQTSPLYVRYTSFQASVYTKKIQVTSEILHGRDNVA